ncbi:cell division protein CrgA [Arthrobacter yangruifuii]|uniref:cell division protein CrgA n=1 Tax=Arthrobacter yangruifuii TaxID=2606616 RepID=UPI0011B682BE|nr:cell division protein CrgA [Arthrobacter yangruifuii]
MPKSKPRKKAVSKKKQARRAEHEINAMLSGETAYFSDEAEALLTSRGWISERDQPGGPDQGDAWYWMPSQLPAYLEEGEPVPTSIYPSSDSTFVSQLATPDGSVPPEAQTEYDSLDGLEADLDRLQAYRVPDGAWTVLNGGPSDEETPEDLIDSVAEEWELIAELIHFPYSDEGPRSFAAVEQAVQDGRLTEYAYRSVLAGRSGR